MNKLPILFSVSAFFVLFSSALKLEAAQNTSVININTTFVDYVKFTGTAVGASKFYTVDEIQPVGTNRRGPRVSLGTLGIESNSPGNCTLNFSTKNNFRLRHLVTNQRLTRYRLRYRNRNITRNRNRTRSLPCNRAPRNFQFQAVGNFRNNPQAGVYQDIVTVTVTTQ